MPDRLVSLLVSFLNGGLGKLSKRARTKEFSSIKESEVLIKENAYGEIFNNGIREKSYGFLKEIIKVLFWIVFPGGIKLTFICICTYHNPQIKKKTFWCNRQV
jgi:hypothetical protein